MRRALILACRVVRLVAFYTAPPEPYEAHRAAAITYYRSERERTAA